MVKLSENWETRSTKFTQRYTWGRKRLVGCFDFL